MDCMLEADETRAGRTNHLLDHFRKSSGILDGEVWCPASRKRATNENSYQINAESSESPGRGIPLPSRKATAANVNRCGNGMENNENLDRDMAQLTREATVKWNFEDSVNISEVVSSDTLSPKIEINCHQESIENSEVLVCEKLDPKTETSRRLNGHQGSEKCSEYLVYEQPCSKTATSARINHDQDGAMRSGCECYKKELSAMLNYQQDACERSGSSDLSQIKTKVNMFSTTADSAKKTCETKNSDYDICKKVLHGSSQSHYFQELNIHQDYSVRGQEHVYLEKNSSLDIKMPVNCEFSPNIGHVLNTIELNTNLQYLPVGETPLMHHLYEHNLELRIPSDIGHQNTFENCFSN